MNPKWPVPEEGEMAKLRAYRDLLAAETAPKEEKEEGGKKLKPSDTAVGIALKNDRQALSEKKFRKLLKKSVFENFSERFGVSEQTQEQLGNIYFEIEETEAKAEEDALLDVKTVYHDNKSVMESELKGRGKEAKKLLERCVDPGCRERKEELKLYLAADGLHDLFRIHADLLHYLETVAVFITLRDLLVVDYEDRREQTDEA